jgi:hypothetical protein
MGVNLFYFYVFLCVIKGKKMHIMCILCVFEKIESNASLIYFIFKRKFELDLLS